MNKIIFKESFTIQEAFILQMPAHAVILKIAYLDGVPTMWYSFDLKETYETAVNRYFMGVGTGNAFTEESGCQYIETLVEYTNGAIWHIFEVAP